MHEQLFDLDVDLLELYEVLLGPLLDALLGLLDVLQQLRRLVNQRLHRYLEPEGGIVAGIGKRLEEGFLLDERGGRYELLVRGSHRY